MKTITIVMKLSKEHKTLLEYTEMTEDGTPISKPRVSPIYLRKGTFEITPNAITITVEAS